MEHHSFRVKTLPPVIAWLAAVALPIGLVAGSPAGAPPDVLNYSGQLNTLSGQPPGTEVLASYRAEFRIYDASAGGNILWAESQTITAENGHFSVIIGEGEAIDGEPRPRLSAALASKDIRHLGITVRFQEAELAVEMSPRQPLLNAPYAMLSTSASQLVGEDGTPLASAHGDTLEIHVPLTISQPVQAAAISGDASGLTHLDASSITSGMLPADRLPSSFLGTTISSGTFSTDRMPVVPAAKVTSIDASRVTSGRLPQSVVGTLDSSQPITFSERQTFRDGLVFPRPSSSFLAPHQPIESIPVHLDPTWSSGWDFSYADVGLGSSPAYQSQKIGHNQETGEMGVTVFGPGTLTFDWRASSEIYDRLRLYRDGGQVTTISGNNTALGVTVIVPAGTHRYTWKYTKDQSIDSLEDRGWVANIRFTRNAVATSPVQQPHSLSLNRNAILLRGQSDSNHILAHGLNGDLSQRWSSPGRINGPVLAGWNGGALATTQSNQWALRWNATSDANLSNVQVKHQLRIRPGISALPSGGFYYWHAQANGSSSVPTTAPVALETSGSIAALSFVAASDRRIKKSITPTATEEALRIVSGLEFVDYRFRNDPDAASRVGLLAQQVRSLDSPSVSLSQRFVPDMFAEPVSTAWNEADETLTLTMENDHALSTGDTVRLIHADGSHDLKVVAVPSPRSFRVEGLTGEPGAILVYGRQVDDFHSIDLDRLFAAGVVSVQEIQRRNRNAQAKLAATRTRLEAARNHRAELLNLRNQLRQAAADQAAHLQSHISTPSSPTAQR